MAQLRKYIHGYFQGEPDSPKNQIQLLGFAFWVDPTQEKADKDRWYAGPPCRDYPCSCCHLTLQGEFDDLQRWELRTASVNTPPHTQHHTALADSAEWAQSCGNCTNWSQAGESHPCPWSHKDSGHECNDQWPNCYLLRLEWKILTRLVLSAARDSDIKYNFILKLFNSGNSSWSACLIK